MYGTIGIISSADKMKLSEYRIVKNYDTSQYIYYDYVADVDRCEREIMKQLEPFRVNNFYGGKSEWIKLGVEKIIGLLLFITQNKEYSPMCIDKCGWSNLV